MTAGWLRVALARVAGQLSPRGDAVADDDLQAELRDHLDRLVAEETARGVPDDEARRRAHLRLGGVAQIREQQREQRRLPLVDAAARDVRFAVRTLRRAPAFTSAVVLTLGIGIGATTAMFGVVRAVLLRPLPYASPDRLVRIYETNPLKRWTRNSAAPANYADWKRQNTVFSDIAAYEVFDEARGATDVFLSGFGDPQRLQAIGVTGNLLRLLGTPPLLGRTFTDAETFEGPSRVVVLSYGLWQSLFAGDPAVVGRTISLSGRTYDIVGVMPAGFFFPRRDVQLWYPVGYKPSVFTQARRPHWLTVIGRLRPGVTLDHAREEMTAVARGLERAYPDTNTEMGVRLEPYHASLVGDARTPLLALFAAVGILFVIVCVNVASLQFGRIAERGREMAIRQALGASRRRLVAQLLVEGAVLSIAGGIVGFGVAEALRAAIVRYGPPTLAVYADLRFDGSVLVFGTILSLAAPIAFGLGPAWSALRPERLNDRAGNAPRQSSIRGLLVAGEVALCVTLVVGAGLLVRTVAALERVDPGFVPDGVLTFRLQLPTARYPDAASRVRAADELERALRERPSVGATGATTTLALGGYTWTGDATVDGQTDGRYERELRHESVTPGYFDAMGIRLLDGRRFDRHDTADGPPVAIVNETLARRYFAGANAVGRRLKYGRPGDNAPWVTVVGVVADARQDGMGASVQPETYDPFGARPMTNLAFAVRTTGRPEAIAADVRSAVAKVDPDLVATDLRPMREVVHEAVGDERFRASLAAAFAAVALTLAAIGLYGVLAYFVTQRTNEIGIRLALGATRSSVFWLVVRQALRPVWSGAAAGFVLAYAGSAALTSLLFGIARLDAPTYAATGAVLALVAAAACAMPARRAVNVDPATSLRAE